MDSDDIQVQLKFNDWFGHSSDIKVIMTTILDTIIMYGGEMRSGGMIYLLSSVNWFRHSKVGWRAYYV
jgi:hypothetical protein